MPENPLLPHRKLRELYALMQRVHALDRKQTRGQAYKAAREALLAATTMQLLPGDLLAPTPEDFTAAQLAPDARKSEHKKPLTSGLLATVTPQRLPQFAAAAKALQASGTDSLILAFTQSGALESGWQPALDYIQSAQLPLVLVVTDPTGGGVTLRRTKPSPNSLTLDTISRFAKRSKLAVLTVDGEDAVAVYRVMQESVLRARLGGGPAVIWAMMSPISGKPKRSALPIPRLEAYLAARNISFTA